LVVYEHRKEGYSGVVPDLSECVSTGESLDKMQSNLREAVDAHIASRIAQRETIPPSTTTTVHFPHPREGHGIDHWVVERLEFVVPDPEQERSKIVVDAQ
jgi:predicted RNase H-like HicB family nuclease